MPTTTYESPYDIDLEMFEKSPSQWVTPHKLKQEAKEMGHVWGSSWWATQLQTSESLRKVTKEVNGRYLIHRQGFWYWLLGEHYELKSVVTR